MFVIFPYRYTPVPDSILAKAGLPGDSVSGLDPVMSFNYIYEISVNWIIFIYQNSFSINLLIPIYNFNFLLWCFYNSLRHLDFCCSYFKCVPVNGKNIYVYIILKNIHIYTTVSKNFGNSWNIFCFLIFFLKPRYVYSCMFILINRVKHIGNIIYAVISL